jgi:hypothetical protein
MIDESEQRKGSGEEKIERNNIKLVYLALITLASLSWAIILSS